MRPRVNAGNRMALEEDQVAAMRFRRGVPEPREANVVERRRRSERGDVATDVAVPVGAHHHRHRIPADVVVDADFHVGIARVLRLPLDRNRVHVLGRRAVGDVDPFLARLANQSLDQEMGTFGPFLIDDAAQRVLPFLGFLRVGIAGAGRQRVFGQSCHEYVS
ncbi:MAG: hypothetical protein AW07_02489 [Candidatus Accumulibacter sp. SK-11]|nr:MAG: hypothetical protein AW07_02489 [Candidatus Accumulibacter sp. SK-11]